MPPVLTAVTGSGRFPAGADRSDLGRQARRLGTHGDSCDTIGQAATGYLDAGDFTPPAAPPTPANSGPDARPATWNRERVIVPAFVRHLQAQGATLELPALGHRRIRLDTTRALSRADVARIVEAPAPLRDKTLWRLLYESAARAGEVLALDVTDLDLTNRRARVIGKGGQVEWITCSH
jgi:integrase